MGVFAPLGQADWEAGPGRQEPTVVPLTTLQVVCLGPASRALEIGCQDQGRLLSQPWTAPRRARGTCAPASGGPAGSPEAKGAALPQAPPCSVALYRRAPSPRSWPRQGSCIRHVSVPPGQLARPGAPSGLAAHQEGTSHWVAHRGASACELFVSFGQTCMFVFLFQFCFLKDRRFISGCRPCAYPGGRNMASLSPSACRPAPPQTAVPGSFQRRPWVLGRRVHLPPESEPGGWAGGGVLQGGACLLPAGEQALRGARRVTALAGHGVGSLLDSALATRIWGPQPESKALGLRPLAPGSASGWRGRRVGLPAGLPQLGRASLCAQPPGSRGGDESCPSWNVAGVYVRRVCI